MLMLLSAFSIAATAPQGSSTTSQPLLPPVRYIPPAIDSAKAQLARSVAAKLLPAGITGEMLRQPFNSKIANLAHSYLMMPVDRFAAEYGGKLPVEGINGPPTVHLRLLGILDPASGERSSIADPIIRTMAAEAAASKEPQLREALARAYGQMLSLSELQQALDRFLATPQGAAYAHASAMLENDLGVFAARQFIDRAILEATPAMLTRLTKATASLLKIRSAADLSDPERKEVADLLHLDSGQLRKK
jgi:hypothetical protein